MILPRLCWRLSVTSMLLTFMETPLHIAARENYLECVTLFLSCGADVTQRNKEGQTALDCCVYGSSVWTALSTNKKLTDARRGRDCCGERMLSRESLGDMKPFLSPVLMVSTVEPCPQNFKYIPDNCVTSPMDIDKDLTHLQEGRLPLDFCQREPPVLFECNQLLLLEIVQEPSGPERIESPTANLQDTDDGLGSEGVQD
ncbi:hypothetical protein INR49_028020, partial [Caranx melampygus]